MMKYHHRPRVNSGLCLYLPILNDSVIKSSSSHIISLIQSLEAAGDYCFLVASSAGEILHLHPRIKELLTDGVGKVLSIFQLLPELTFAQWTTLLGARKSTLIKVAEQNEVGVPLLFHSIRLDGEPLGIAFVPVAKPQPKSQEIIPVLRDSESITPTSSAPETIQPIFYFDAAGIIQEAYPLEYQDQQYLGKSIDQFFLKTDYGSLSTVANDQSLSTRDLHLRLIFKSGKGFVDGYGILSQLDRGKQKLYRLQYHDPQNIQILGNPYKTLSEESNEILHSEPSEFSFDAIVSRSDAYKEILRLVAQVADTTTTVLITGETGTGKELICNAIHRLSDRSDRPIIKVNCAAIPKDLIESTLFGHEKGAFTGAYEKRIGKFEVAHQGTIFLDEIGELPIDLQPKLLRVLQEGEIERLGQSKPIAVDVRIIAATNRDLEQFVADGRFRQDLYYRINIFPIHNLPLRERKEDIPLLIEHFIQKFNKKLDRAITEVPPKVMTMLLNYDYPGNVRELENMIERAMVLSEGHYLQLNSLPSYSKASRMFLSLEEQIKEHIIEALQMANGKVTGSDSAAELLDINGRTLVSKIKKMGIDPKLYK